MGAWGLESFENDDAADWIYDFEDNGASQIKETLNSITAPSGDSYLEAPDCSMALAAAECVAAAVNGDQSRLSPSAITALEKHQTEVKQGNFTAKARSAVEKISTNSELRELWEETDDFANWLADVNELLVRLK